jgi:hypothetical protein
MGIDIITEINIPTMILLKLAKICSNIPASKIIFNEQYTSIGPTRTSESTAQTNIYHNRLNNAKPINNVLICDKK